MAETGAAPAPPAEPGPVPEIVPPQLELLNGNEYFNTCVPLHHAALKGNWEVVKGHTEKHPLELTLLEKAIARGGSTILHVAAGARKRTFVKKLLDSVKQNDNLTRRLLLQVDQNGNNAFCIAAAAGDVEIAKLMLKTMPDLNLQTIGGVEGKTPLYMAVLFGQKDMANFLYPDTVPGNFLGLNHLKDLVSASIDGNLYGITLKLLGHCHSQNRVIWTSQAEENGIDQTALHKLAQKPNLKTKDALKLVELLWERLTDSHTSGQVKSLIKTALFDAAKLGNFEFIEVAVRFHPDLIYERDDASHSIFDLAVQHRYVDIFNLINRMGFHKHILSTYTDNTRNSLLHLAANYPNPPPAKIVPGAALELQREILMFEEVERSFPPSYGDRQKNSDDKTPKELFTETHSDLKKSGEKWMQRTAGSCMLVATLIATVVFAAAFTVPGGNHQQTGKPFFLHKNLFKVFAVSDDIALFSSSISILIFLSILTSCYEEKDFRLQLPLKLIFGLLTLFISVIAMTVAFSSAIFLFYNERWNGITILSCALILLAGILFLFLHFPVLKDVIRSTFCSRNQIKTKCLPV